jgi:hypothetical protein
VAPGRLAFKTKTHVVRAQDVGGGTTRCPRGSQILGGGVFVAGAPNDGAWVVESRFTADREGWRGALVNGDTSRETISVRAVCANGRLARNLVYRERTQVAPEQQQSSATNNCPSGASAVSGGAHLRNPFSRINSTGVQSSGLGSVTFVDVGTSTKFSNYLVCLR